MPRPPRIAAIYLNTVWASHGVTLKDQTLGSSNGERNQSFTFAKAPVLKGEAIEVREVSVAFRNGAGADLRRRRRGLHTNGER